jgi:WSC domain-containing protein
MVTSAVSTSSGVVTISLLRAGPHSDATRQLHNLSKRGIDLLTLLKTRDSVAARTLAAVGYIDTTNMNVETCVNFCNTRNFIYAGVENGQECRKWCLSSMAFSFLSLSVILIIRFGNKIVGMSYPTGRLQWNQIVAFHATAIQMRIVVPTIA